MIFSRVASVTLATALAACSAPEKVATNSNALILNDDLGDRLVDLCSREAPPAYDGRWQVSQADVRTVERVLLDDHAEILARAEIAESDFVQDYVRDYAGFTREGRRYLYGSYGPMPGIGLCDGGPGFFGVEYEMPSGKVTHVDYNGGV